MKKTTLIILMVFLFSGCVTPGGKTPKTEDSKSVASLYDKGEKDQDVRKEIVVVLGKYDNTETIDPLIRALGDPRSEIQVLAVKGLQKYPHPRVIQAFIQKLEERKSGPDFREALIFGLAHQKAAKAPEVFLSLFPKEETENVLIAYLKVFTNPFQMKEAEKLIIQKLKHDSKKVRVAAVMCIRELALVAAAWPIIKQAEKEEPGEWKKEYAAPAVVKKARKKKQKKEEKRTKEEEKERNILEEMRICLVSLQNHGVSLELVRQIEEGKDHMKTLAGDVLSGYVSKDYGVMADLVRVGLNKESPLTKMETVKVLSSYDNHKLALPLSYHLRDDSRDVRFTALQALGKYNKISDPEILERIFYLSEREWESDILEASVSVLKKVNLKFISEKAKDWIVYAGKSEKEGTLKGLNKAIQLLTKATGFFDNDENMRLRLAALNLRAGKRKEAIRQYQIAWKKFSSGKGKVALAEIYTEIGQEKLDVNHYFEAMKNLKKALTYDPKNQKTANKLGEAYARNMEAWSFFGYAANAYLQNMNFQKLAARYAGVEKQWRERASFAFMDARQTLKSVQLDERAQARKNQRSPQSRQPATEKKSLLSGILNPLGTSLAALSPTAVRPEESKQKEKKETTTVNEEEGNTGDGLPLEEEDEEEESADGFGPVFLEEQKAEEEKTMPDASDISQKLKNVQGQLNVLMRSQYLTLAELSDKIVISYTDALRKLGERSGGKGKSKKKKPIATTISGKQEAVDAFKLQLLGFFEKKFKRRSDNSAMRYLSQKESKVFVLAITPKPEELKGADLIYVRTLYFPNTKVFEDKAEITLIFRHFNDKNSYYEEYEVNYEIGETRVGE